MEYHYNIVNKLFDAKLNVNDNDTVSCENATCEDNKIADLTECLQMNVTISHNSCGLPNKALTLKVPPGKYKLASICIFTKQYNSTCLAF